MVWNLFDLPYVEVLLYMEHVTDVNEERSSLTYKSPVVYSGVNSLLSSITLTLPFIRSCSYLIICVAFIVWKDCSFSRLQYNAVLFRLDVIYRSVRTLSLLLCTSTLMSMLRDRLVRKTHEILQHLAYTRENVNLWLFNMLVGFLTNGLQVWYR